MNRKFTIVGVCLLVAGLLVIMVIRGGKRPPRTELPRDNFSVTVDIPKTNNTAAKASGR